MEINRIINFNFNKLKCTYLKRIECKMYNQCIKNRNNFKV